MLKSKQPKCATPSIKELLEALDLEERNDHRSPGHEIVPQQYIPQQQVSPQGPASWPPHGGMPGAELEHHRRRFDHVHETIAPIPGSHAVEAARLYQSAEILPLRPEPLRPDRLRTEPLRPLHDTSDARTLLQIAATARTNSYLSPAVAMLAGFVVMVPSALYLIAPLVWNDASTKPAPGPAGAVIMNESSSTKRPFAVASIAVVPIAAPRAGLPAAAPLASTANDLARFSALSHAATVMRLPSADAPAQAPAAHATAAPMLAASPAHVPATNAAPLVPSPQPPASSEATVAAAPTAPMAGEPLRARVPLTALSADPPGLGITAAKPATVPNAAAPLAAKQAAHPGTAIAPANQPVAAPAPKDSLTAARAAILIERGRQLADLGNITGARLLYELAAKSGNAEGQRLFDETLAAAVPAKNSTIASTPAVLAPRPKFAGASALGAPGAGKGLANSAVTPAD